MFAIIFINPFKGGNVNVLGKWVTDDGKYIEFLSDGTMETDIRYSKKNPCTYEILPDGYLKWGIYDPAWIQYSYDYWKIEIKGKKMVLTSKDKPDKIIELSKE